MSGFRAVCRGFLLLIPVGTPRALARFGKSTPPEPTQRRPRMECRPAIDWYPPHSSMQGLQSSTHPIDVHMACEGDSGHGAENEAGSRKESRQAKDESSPKPSIALPANFPESCKGTCALVSWFSGL